jgi:hypothetical protein
MNRLASLCAGLIALPVIGVGLAYTEPAPHPLCDHGHPAKRAPGVTYGGLLPLHHYQRDHVCPLGLGCPDVIENVRYQRCDRTGQFGRCEAGPAKEKDDDEHEAEENSCSGRWTQDYARSWLAGRWPVDAAHGYDKP